MLSEPIWAASCTFSAFHIHTRSISIRVRYIFQLCVCRNSWCRKKTYTNPPHLNIFYVLPLAIWQFLLLLYFFSRMASTTTKTTDSKLYVYSFSGNLLSFFYFFFAFLIHFETIISLSLSPSFSHSWRWPAYLFSSSFFQPNRHFLIFSFSIYVWVRFITAEQHQFYLCYEKIERKKNILFRILINDFAYTDECGHCFTWPQKQQQRINSTQNEIKLFSFSFFYRISYCKRFLWSRLNWKSKLRILIQLMLDPLLFTLAQLRFLELIGTWIFLKRK